MSFQRPSIHSASLCLTTIVPCLAGESFTVQVTANSPSAAIASWFLPLYYDSGVIAYTGNTINNALWATPYLNSQASVLTGTPSKTFQ